MTDQAMEFPLVVVHHPPWNKNRIIGQKAPFKLKEICAIRAWLDFEHNVRDRALLDVAVDSKMRGGDVTRLRVEDVATATRLPHGPVSGKARRNVR
ncbi:MAG: integrase [Deltaproteobacteria bacterium]|nr:integrase [Deltaproteobacteria bacterium]